MGSTRCSKWTPAIPPEGGAVESKAWRPELSFSSRHACKIAQRGIVERDALGTVVRTEREDGSLEYRDLACSVPIGGGVCGGKGT